jgi:periplasmic protein TonB
MDQPHISKSQFEASLATFRWKSWVMALLAAFLLNCGLFLFLPLYIGSPNTPKDIETLVDHIQVIRIKKLENPAEKKKKKPPEPPKKEQEPKEKIKTQKPALQHKLTLPFKLNTRLPSISTDFQLPYQDTIDFGPAFNGAIDVSQLDRPLTTISRIPPVYPIRARRKGVEGWVRVGFEVDERGYVDNLTILEAKPSGFFEKSVMRCVTKWRYKPGTVEGIPVRARMETTIRFEME